MLFPIVGDTEAEQRVERAFEVTRALRALRAEIDLPAMKTIPEAFLVGDLHGGEAIVRSQAWVEKLTLGAPPELDKVLVATVEGVDIYLPFEGLVDVEKEMLRLDKEQEKTQAELVKLEQRLSNPQFVERAKPEVVEREREQAAELRDRLEKLEARRAMFASS